MYANQQEWIRALAEWMETVPSIENQKKFMVFEGEEASTDTFMFDGELLDFAECYHEVDDWQEVLIFLKDSGYSYCLEGTVEYDEMNLLLDAVEAERDAAQQEFEEAKWGGPGLYDAGGHMKGDVAAEYADILKDQRKYGD